VTENKQRDVAFAVTLATAGLALLSQIAGHPEFIIAEVLLAVISSYLVLRHFKMPYWVG
jgi:hypothetical protein